jgi:hypothetical protein
MHPMTQHPHRAPALKLSAVFIALSALISASPALAESPNYADVDAAPLIQNSYWEGTIPSADLVGVSVDVALPLPLSLTLYSDDIASALPFVEVSVVPAATPDATPAAGTLTYLPGQTLLLWAPTEPLDPSTEYVVHVFVNNEGLYIGGAVENPNITGSFNVTTSASALTALATVVPEPTVTFIDAMEYLSCPPGEVVCNDDPPVVDGDGVSHGGGCDQSVSFSWQQPVISIDWSDGEAAGEELFFSYRVTTMNGEAAHFFTNGAQTLESTHSASLTIYLNEARSEEVCVMIEATDLRALARGSADGTTTTTHCVSLADMPPIPDPEPLLAACVPDPNAPNDDIGGNLDASSGGDTSGDTSTSTNEDTGATSGGNTDATPSSDAASGSNNDESGCGCTTTRSQQKQAPAGLLLGLAVAFGAALSLRRRQKTLTAR